MGKKRVTGDVTGHPLIVRVSGFSRPDPCGAGNPGGDQGGNGMAGQGCAGKVRSRRDPA